MAKRTLKSQYAAKDATLSTKRQLLSGDTDLAEICYEVAPEAEVESTEPPPTYTAAVPKTSFSSPKAAVVSPAANPSKKPDAPVSALEVIVAVIAQKLKKSADDIPTSSTIKSLVSGMLSPPPPIYIA
jgi:fatty acid synthase subunit alpha